ncbi:ubiquitin fusion degradation protein UFD1-domain-containing protein [Gaertneriomyces semiglobifer]|nr:ubiquitin fusion degradation protein UFD1-domain-containing protein [Gaertneriomyces semiglobifer]
MFGGHFGGYYGDDAADAFMHTQHSGPFSQTLRAYSFPANLLNTRPTLPYTGKIILPQSSLHRLSALQTTYPMIFRLTNPTTSTSTHSGVLEFTAEEGRCYLPPWLMSTLGLSSGAYINITSTSLPLGKYVKIQPQSTQFLDISDPKAVLEHALRGYTTLTKDDIFVFRYNDQDYDIKVVETKPETPDGGISVVETDLEVDFEAPKGYVEPDYKSMNQSTTPASGSVPKATLDSVQQHIKHDPTSFASFSGSGNVLRSKPTNINANNAQNITASSSGKSAGPPPALHLPPGKLFFGYPVIPLKKNNSENGSEEDGNPEGKKGIFEGEGKTLKGARRGG